MEAAPARPSYEEISMRPSRRCSAVLLLLALAFAAPSAWAGPRRVPEGAGPAWSLLTQLWQSFAAGWTDVGCIIDPYGGCGNAQAPTPETEVGCIADPYGGCGAGQAPTPPSQIDEGCWLDPNGGCRH
jgi:hypothetical protein